MKMSEIKNNSGFSLIEVMIAMTIFAFGLLAVVSMQVTALRGNSGSRDMTEATILAQEIAEEFYILDYAHTDLTVGNHGPVVDGNYSYNWFIAEDGTDEDGNGTLDRNRKKTITLTVQYQRRAKTQQVQVVTMKSELI